VRVSGVICVSIGLFISSSFASAGTFNFNGTFTQDDGSASFLLFLNSPSVITIDTTSYASGGFRRQYQPGRL
jgi:hypothetical protein